jgi:TetR/AcrR family transcriptional regulator, cholesterol catabolism regulator
MREIKVSNHSDNSDRAKSAKASRSPVTVPATQSPRAQAKRELILDAAAEVLAKRGFAGTTLAEIAHGAGTLPGSMYYHFASRDDLVTAVLLRGIGLIQLRVLDALHSLGPTATAKQRLETGLRAQLAFVLEKSAYALAGVKVLGQLPDGIKAIVGPANAAFERVVLQLFIDAAAEGAIDASVNLPALRLLLAGATNWTAQWHENKNGTPAGEIADLLLRLLFTGISTAQP